MKAQRFKVQSSREDQNPKLKRSIRLRFWFLNFELLLSFHLLGLVLFVATTLNVSGATFIVNMQGFQFVPRDLTVNVGDTVIWTNRDSAIHTTTSGTNGVKSGLWDSGNLGRGGSFP